MRPLTLTAKNFGSYADLTVDFSRLSLAAIVGDNGAGKSTVLEAVRVALYGTAAGSLGGFVKQGTGGMSVALEFAAHGHVYRVMREHGTRGQKVTLHHKNGEELTTAAEPKVREVDEAITRITGMDAATFALTSFLPQGGLTRFATLDPADRKAWLISQLPLSHWNDLEAQAKAQAKELETRVTQGEAQVEALSGVVCETTPEEVKSLTLTASSQAATLMLAKANLEGELEAESARQEVEGEIGDLRAEFSGGKATLDAALRRLDVIDGDAATYRIIKRPDVPEGDEDAMRAELEVVDKGHRRLTLSSEEARTNKREADANLERETGAYNLAVANKDAASKALDELTAHVDDCPTCGAKPEHQDSGIRISNAKNAYLDASVVVTVAEEKVTYARKAVEVAQEAFDKVEAALAKYEREVADPTIPRLQKALAAIANSREALAAYDRAQARLDSLAKERIDVAQEAKDAQMMLDIITGRGNDLNARLAAMPGADTDSARRTVSEAQDAYHTADVALRTAEAQLKAYSEGQERAAHIVTSLEADRRSLDNLTMLAKAYGKNGVQARLIEESVAGIETSANDFLSRFTDGLSVELNTQRENKSGTTRETLDILVTDSEGTRPLERMSGGETTRVCFALSAGLAALVQAQTDSSSEAFAVDEPSGLDEAGFTELVNCMHVLSQSIPLVLLITHEQRVIEGIGQHIKVEKGASGSRIEVSL